MVIDSGGVAPEQFEVVEFAKFVVEDMDDDIDKVDDGPATLLEAGAAKRNSAIFFSEGFDFPGNGSDLLRTGAGADNEMFGDGAAVGQLQDDNPGAMSLLGQTGELAGQVATGGQVIRAGSGNQVFFAFLGPIRPLLSGFSL